MSDQPDNKDIILQSARTLITQKGVASTTLADIARQSGIAKGTLHYHFPSKNDILIALADAQVKQYSSRFLALAQEHCSDQHRRQALHSIIEQMAQPTSGALLIHLIMEGSAGNEELRGKFLKKYAEWTQTLEYGLSRLFATVAPDSSPIILALLIGFLFHTIIGAPPLAASHILEFMLKGILPAPPPHGE
jgi:AcrR family transcriptional regulator